jgi:hypothetical protein
MNSKKCCAFLNLTTCPPAQNAKVRTRRKNFPKLSLLEQCHPVPQVPPAVAADPEADLADLANPITTVCRFRAYPTAQTEIFSQIQNVKEQHGHCNCKMD